MKILKKILGSALVEKIMIVVFSLIAGAAVITFLVNQINKSKNVEINLGPIEVINHIDKVDTNEKYFLIGTSDFLPGEDILYIVAGARVSHVRTALFDGNSIVEVYEEHGNESLPSNQKIISGMVAVVYDNNGNVLNEYTIIVPGDIMKNGVFAESNADAMTDHIKLKSLLTDPIQEVAADLNRDGHITAEDANIYIRIFVNGVESKYSFFE